MQRSLLSLLVVLLTACSSASTSAQSNGHTPRAPALSEGQAEAVFAGGCFWCMEHPFERLDGVASVTSGYIGGRVEGPSYEQVSRGGTGHAEAVRVVYDPDVVSYDRLLEVFWHNVDPTQRDGQFCDHGDQYRTAIFPVNDAQRRAAEASLARIRRQLDRPIATRIEPSAPFWVAEDYHQDFYRTHPVRYRTYRSGCGRDRRLQEIWGDAAGH